MCDYFVLTKQKDETVNDDSKNQILIFSENVFILPKNLINYYMTNGLFESRLIEWCKIFGNLQKSFLDIGAHTGTYGINLSSYFKHVYCFEPQRLTYYALCGSVSLSNIKNVTCYNVGLGTEEQCGMKCLNIISLDGGGSSLLEQKDEVLGTEVIEVRTLDSYNLKDVGFIKMDVEGNEANVLLGSKQTLIDCDYPKILFEMNKTNPELISFLQNIGYKIIHINGSVNMCLAERPIGT